MTAGRGSRQGVVVELRGLTKRYGSVTAVDGLDARVEPGRVTGFLGPNGAGKTTTLRLLLGLARPTAGTAVLDGRPFASLDDPARRVGAALDGGAAAPARSGRDHLRWLAAGAGIPTGRCDEVLDLVGLTGAARRRVGGYSLGMRQRLQLAAALLGDPEMLVLDEPANGLDPQGIAWLRGFLRALAAEGRTVLVSSHVLSEVEQTVDTVLVLAAGRLAYAGELRGLAGPPGVVVASPTPDLLAEALRPVGAVVSADGADGPPGALVARAADPGAVLDPAVVGAAAARAGVELHHLAPTTQRLEDAFLRLVARTEAEASRRTPVQEGAA
ncbi:ATP-binding cassette domain-containing protein [Aquipuribacter sp. SD81]|uniref:ATP-binding cassette domain-containing protein n=1 Tax=Aquipuribacter sp. SD81 TaxID=3127703 RepID=UPI0030179D72